MTTLKVQLELLIITTKTVDKLNKLVYNTIMDKLFLLVIVVGLHAYWIYKLVNYDWNNFEKDSEGDDFLKPYE